MVDQGTVVMSCLSWDVSDDVGRLHWERGECICSETDGVKNVQLMRLFVACV